MAEFTGEYDGYSYVVMWDKAAPDVAIWTAEVRKGEEPVARPHGRLLKADTADGDVSAEVQLAVECSIRAGLGVG